MKRIAVFRIFCLLLLVSCAQVKNSQQQKPMPNAIPIMRITGDTSATALRISSLDIDVEVAANVATTTFDIVFYNPNDRVLEGEFEFPLTDGQHIVRYALDIEGKLREGVVVEKAKARVAYENTIRRKIDPGLVEKTKGNNFRTRVYPLPAKGTRHILITVEQTLEQLNMELLYQLPLSAAEPIDKFSLKAAVVKSSEKPVSGDKNPDNLQFERSEQGWSADYSRNNFIANHVFAFAVPNSSLNETITIAENHNGQTYFYMHSRVEPVLQKKKMPGTVGIFWDISASGEKRDLEKEKQLLKAYLTDNVTVSLIPFNIYAQEKEEFSIQNGNCDALLKRIDALQYDGGTQLGAIDLRKYNFEEALLFSDGLANFGKKELALSAIPVITINSSLSADYSYLKLIAKLSHGQFIDLSRQEVVAEAERMKNMSLDVVSIEFSPAEAEDVVTQVMPVQSSGFSLAGKLKTSSADIKINFGFGGEKVTTKTYTIGRPDKSEYDQVKRIWAEMKISELDLQFENNKAAITKLGKDFSIVTQNTSLIVLDRVEDYVEHEITPPAELQKEYHAKLAVKKHIEETDKNAAMEQAVNAMKDLKDWWDKDFKPGKRSTTDSLVNTQNTNGLTVSRSVSDLLEVQAVGTLNYSPVTDSSVTYFYDNAAGYATPNSNAVSFHSISEEAKAESGADTYQANNTTVSIELNDWKPDAPYLKELEKVNPGQRIAKYFDLKKKYAAQPSFFIDVARFFIAKNEKRMGLLVLSNVAELKLEDAELLRNLAEQLMEANEKELAVETFRDVMKMREEDPQSYRDLGLALSEVGKYNEAVELLYKVITESWDGRFGEVKSVALNEMNAIIAANNGAVNISGIDSRLIYAMPVDVRIVIGWSSDNSDIDLWVTDPRNERCAYDHPDTEIGGKISQDVTQGFGPEEFCLKKASNGKYKVEVNLFGDSRQTIGGPISIKADLYTDYGRPGQKKQTINFRVTNDKEVVELGSLKFGS